jgi:hypothetical protein
MAILNYRHLQQSLVQHSQLEPDSNLVQESPASIHLLGNQLHEQTLRVYQLAQTTYSPENEANQNQYLAI